MTTGRDVVGQGWGLGESRLARSAVASKSEIVDIRGGKIKGEIDDKIGVQGYEHVNSGATHGFAGVLNTSDAGVSGLNDGFENTITSSNSRATKVNSLVPCYVVGFRDDEEHISSSLKPFGSLQMVMDDARAVPDFDE
nr:hypothetical protein CFP56_52961 [Quercus suber]